MGDYRIIAGKRLTCIRRLITIRDTLPTTQTSYKKWNLSATTITSSVDSLPVYRQQGVQFDGCHKWNHRTCNSSDIVSVFESPLNGKACRAKYRILDGIESKIFVYLLFSNACCSDSKSPISPVTVPGAVTYLATASICESDDLCF